MSFLARMLAATALVGAAAARTVEFTSPSPSATPLIAAINTESSCEPGFPGITLVCVAVLAGLVGAGLASCAHTFGCSKKARVAPIEQEATTFANLEQVSSDTPTAAASRN